MPQESFSKPFEAVIDGSCKFEYFSSSKETFGPNPSRICHLTLDELDGYNNNIIVMIFTIRVQSGAWKIHSEGKRRVDLGSTVPLRNRAIRLAKDNNWKYLSVAISGEVKTDIEFSDIIDKYVVFIENYGYGEETVLTLTPYLQLLVNSKLPSIYRVCTDKKVILSFVKKKDFFNYLTYVDNRSYSDFVSIQGQFLSPILTKNDAMAPYLSAIRTKPFLLLAGISGTGKSRIVRRLAQATVPYALHAPKDTTEEAFNTTGRWELHKPENFELIQVKPNWHNSMDVVGYQTNIPEPHYVFTPFVKFIIKAWKNPEVPFFLCLDEMNLAPVEEYFAEFLSAIESRSKENGVFKTDPIIPPFGPMKNSSICDRMIEDLDLSLQDDKDIVEHLKKDGLTLPENLIVIGTVNMDETTCSFSRKVLDRAMSFEMNEVDFDQFLKGDSDIIHEPFEKPVISNLIHRPILADEVKGNIDADGVILYLKAINGVLDGTPFKLGYRAANEALLYVDASKVFGQEDLATALDEFTLMKVLSRIEGDSSKLSVKKAYGNPNRKTLLDELKEVILERLSKHEEQAVETDMEIGVDENPNDGEPYPSEKPNTPARELMSIQKLDRMIDQLERNGFVSYWE